MSAVHDAGHHVSDRLGGVVGHRHASDLLLNGAVRVDPASELKREKHVQPKAFTNALTS